MGSERNEYQQQVSCTFSSDSVLIASPDDETQSQGCNHRYCSIESRRQVEARGASGVRWVGCRQQPMYAPLMTVVLYYSIHTATGPEKDQ